MGRFVDLDDLVDVVEVASLIGLTNFRGLYTYRARYQDFPEPVWASTGGRCQAWLRQDIEDWKASRQTK